MRRKATRSRAAAPRTLTASCSVAAVAFSLSSRLARWWGSCKRGGGARGAAGKEGAGQEVWDCLHALSTRGTAQTGSASASGQQQEDAAEREAGGMQDAGLLPQPDAPAEPAGPRSAHLDGGHGLVAEGLGVVQQRVALVSILSNEHTNQQTSNKFCRHATNPGKPLAPQQHQPGPPGFSCAAHQPPGHDAVPHRLPRPHTHTLCPRSSSALTVRCSLVCVGRGGGAAGGGGGAGRQGGVS